MHSLVMFLYFAGLASQLSSLSPYALAHFGESGSAVLAAAQIGTPLGAFLAGWLSDRLKRVRLLAIAGLTVAIPLQILTFAFSDSIGLSVAMTFVLRLTLSGVFQVLTIAALEAAGNENFGRIRSSGTVGFLFAQLALYFVSTPAFASYLPQTSAAFGQSGALFFALALLPAQRLAQQRQSPEAFYFADALGVLRQRHMLYFVGLAFLFFSAYQITDNYVARYFELIGGMNAVFLSWVIAVLPEIVLLVYISRIERRHGIRALFWLAALSGLARFALLFVAAKNPGNAALLHLFAQLLHSFHFTGHYMGAVYFLRLHTGAHLYGSVAGIYALVSQSLGGIAGNFLYGALLFQRPAAEHQLQSSDFLSLFALAAFTQLLLLPAYFWLRESPAVSTKETSSA